MVFARLNYSVYENPTRAKKSMDAYYPCSEALGIAREMNKVAPTLYSDCVSLFSISHS